MVQNNQSEFATEFKHFSSYMLYFFCLVLCFFLILCILAYFRISSYTFDTYDTYNEVPHYKVGLLLGTSPYTVDGNKNEYFTNRIQAAVTLFKKKKIDYILVSGDNRHYSYNEPQQMTRALLKQGIPKNRIISDYAGFSTLDSIIRARKVFLLDEVLIISQRFHNERAIFIADHQGLKAKGFNASDHDSDIARFKVGIREIFARLKCILDIYVLNTQPVFLGDPISIGGASLPKTISNKPKYPTSMPKQISASVEGLAQQNLEKLKKIAKQPTDAAIILVQENKAKKRMYERINKENEDND